MHRAAALLSVVCVMAPAFAGESLSMREYEERCASTTHANMESRQLLCAPSFRSNPHGSRAWFPQRVPWV